MVQNSAWEYKNKAIRINTKWIETGKQKLINELIVLIIDSLTLTKQIAIKPCFHINTIHMLLKMEYLYPLLPNLEVFYLLHKLQICLKVEVAPPTLGEHIIEKHFFVI